MQKKDLEVFLYCIISDIESTADQGKIEVGLLCHLIGFDQLVKPACVEAVVSKLSFLQDHNEMLHDSSEVSPDPELLGLTRHFRKSDDREVRVLSPTEDLQLPASVSATEDTGGPEAVLC